jgi:DNA-binding SARP family transcriptional activator/predicted ATPase
MSRLILRLLGPPEIEENGNVLAFPTRKSLALLIYLVVAGSRQPRDHLAALLWPESSASRAALRNSLYQLRARLPAGHFLLLEQDTIGFNFSADYQLDLDLVQMAVSPQATIDSQLIALDAYRGDFLTGFSLDDAPDFDNWASLQRERWHQYLDELFDQLSEAQMAQGQIRPSLETTTRWIAHNPFSEAAYCRLMRLHLAAGDRSAALQAYDTCRQTLADELGLSPTPETTALAELIQHDMVEEPESSLSKRWLSGKVTPSVHPFCPSSLIPHPSSFAHGPLVGRAAAFEALVTAYHRATRGTPQLVILVGESGMGKTRLAADFLAWAGAQGADLLYGRSFESSRQLPYQPLVEALRPQLEAINAPEDLLSDIWLAELSRLLPELLERYPDLQPVQLDETASRPRLFEAITRLMLSLARHVSTGAPLLLFLDDMQWADSASLDVLQYAGRRWQEQRTPLMLLVAARAEALHPLSVAHAPQLADCLAGLERQLTAVTLTLQPLTMADTTQFLAAFGASETDEFARWLSRETGGHPFYLVETLADLQEQGEVTVQADASGKQRLSASVPSQQSPPSQPAGNLPQKVRQVITARLARLNPAAFALLAAGAVLGRDFTFDLVCQVAALSEGEGLPALDELLRSHLLREQEAHYLFTHDSIRDVAYTEAGDARRRIFHRRALAALATQDTPAAQLAYHAQAAGETAVLFDYSLAAGEESLAIFAAREAIAQFEQARRITHQVTVTSEQWQRLYLPLGRAYELVGDYETALARYDELQDVGRQREDKGLELAALMATTTVYAAPTAQIDPQNVAELTAQTLPLARELVDRDAEAKILWNLMLIKLFAGNLLEAVTDGEASLAIARQYHLPERMAYALHDLTRAYLFSGRWEEGLAAAAEAQQLWRRLGNQAMLADNLVTSASTRWAFQGMYPELISQLQEALALSESIDNQWNQAYAHHVLGDVYFDLGCFSQSIAACEQAIERGVASGFMIPLFANGGILAWLYGLMGYPERGWPWVEKGLADETGTRDMRAGLLAVKAYLYQCQGEMDAAEASMQQSYDHVELDALSLAAFFTFPLDGRLRLARGEYEAALAAGERLMGYLQQTGLQPFRSDALYIQGRALWALDRTGEARTVLEAARQEAERLHTRRNLWEILAAQAQMAAAQWEVEMAVGLRHQAGEVIQFIADHIEEDELRAGFLREAAAASDS